MTRYPAYRDSGLAWIGTVPQHWPVIRNKYIFREVEDRSDSGEETLLSLTRDRGLIPQTEYSDREGSADSLVGYRYCKPGHIVMNRMQAWNGMFGLVRVPGLVSPDYTVLQPIRGVNLQFIAHLFKTPSMIGIFRQRSRGIGTGFFRLYTPDFGDIAIALPPRAEQDTIVAYLDRKLAGIDDLIAKKQRLIALLHEQRAAVINRAVTRGLNPTVPTKPSGIPWLGDIPAHWEVNLLKRIIRQGTSISYGIVQPGDPLESGGVPFVQTTNMTSGRLQLEDLQRTTREIANQYPRSTLRPGDVILGIRASIGAAHVVPPWLDGANLSRGVARIVVGTDVLPAYLVLLFQSAIAGEYWNRTRQGTTFNEVPIAAVRELPLVLPPITEQHAIIERLDQEKGKIQEVVNSAEREIELLRELRAALIAEAVTGKIDVRAYQAPSPLGEGRGEVPQLADTHAR